MTPTDRLAMPEHLSIDREGVVPDLIAVRYSFGKRSVHGSFARLLERRNCPGWADEIHRHIAAATQCWLKLFHRKKYFAGVPSGINFGLYIYTGPTKPLYCPAAKSAPARTCVW